MYKSFLPALVLAATGAAAETTDITVEIWVDNWFAVYANGDLVLEDPVSITTERSFNAETETFTVALPATIGLYAKDFKENDSGLEYIGTRRQQMGDGGMIAQFKNAATGEVLAVTDANTVCDVLHFAPVDTSCADEDNPVAGEGACAFEASDLPSDWADVDFDASAWAAATEHSEAAVDPKFGYDEITWADDATLIWGPNLKQDNTLVCRLEIGG